MIGCNILAMLGNCTASGLRQGAGGWRQDAYQGLLSVGSVGCWPFDWFGFRCSFDGRSMAV
eukprot:906496-Lingulodinium_polyedra.AAC.1